MKIVRAIEIEKCALCGEECDKLYMHKIFTGRTKYICDACHKRGNRQVDGRRKDWRRSSRGKQVIEQLKKNR